MYYVCALNICENLEQLLMVSQIFIMHGSKCISKNERYYCLLNIAWGNLLLKIRTEPAVQGKKEESVIL